MPVNSSETNTILTCAPADRIGPTPHPDHDNEVITQLCFSSTSVALSRSLSRLADNDVDSAACQIHAAVCSYKSNSECLQTKFEFEFINRSSNFRTSFNKPNCDVQGKVNPCDFCWHVRRRLLTHWSYGSVWAVTDGPQHVLVTPDFRTSTQWFTWKKDNTGS